MTGPKLDTTTRLFPRVQLRFSDILIFVVLFFSVSGAAGEPAGAITRIQGTVVLKRPGSEQRRVVQGDAVSVGDDLRTEKDSGAQATFTDGSFVNLFPGSSLRVNQYSFDRGTGRRTARVRIISGKARFVLYTILSGESAFLIETDTAVVAADMLGDFGITVERSATEVVALDRSVRVKNASPLIAGEISLGVNQKTAIREKAAPSRPVTLSERERKAYRRDVRFMGIEGYSNKDGRE